jgi:signal transduction histidine kinase
VAPPRSVRSFVNVYHPEDVQLVVAATDDGIANRRPFSAEYWIIHRDGSTRWVSERGRPVFDENGAVAHIDGVIFDTIERHQMEEELRQTLAELRNATDQLAYQERFATIGKVAATVSHELRNPLGAIRSSMFLVRTVAGDRLPDMERAIERVDRNVERCARIINDLLAFTQKRELKREATLIDRLVAEILNGYQLADGLELGLDLRCQATITLDREAFREIVLKLLENAVQALQDPAWKEERRCRRQIMIRSEVAGSLVRLLIADTGPGIPSDVLPNVFEPLFTTKGFGVGRSCRKVGGDSGGGSLVGLGLPTVRQLVEQHDGTINIESVAGAGTTVVVCLPS